MVNQRGQAFSVFELMIAGVVAFAILIVLLMVIGGVNPFGNTQDAKTVIANGIRSISPSGDTTTGVFEISRNGITNDDLTDKTGLDAKSIVFDTGHFGAGNSPNDSVIVPSSGSGVQYNGSNTLRAKARVICKQTGQKLADYLSEYVAPSGKYALETDPISDEACGTEEYQPCCIILLERPTR